MIQKRYALIIMISTLITTNPLFAVDSEALGEELKKGQNRAETQKPTPQKQINDNMACASTPAKPK